MSFKCVGYVPGYKGQKDVKIILQQDGNNNLTPTGSYKGDTIYIALDIKTQELDHIYYYKYHDLVKSIDVREKCGPHYHNWSLDENGNVSRPKHRKSNTYTDFTPEDLYYMREGDKFAKEYIKKHKQ